MTAASTDIEVTGPWLIEEINLALDDMEKMLDAKNLVAQNATNVIFKITLALCSIDQDGRMRFPVPPSKLICLMRRLNEMALKYKDYQFKADSSYNEKIFNFLRNRAKYVFLGSFYQLLNTPTAFPPRRYGSKSRHYVQRKMLADQIKFYIDPNSQRSTVIPTESSIEDKFSEFVGQLKKGNSKKHLQSLKEYFGDDFIGTCSFNRRRKSFDDLFNAYVDQSLNHVGIVPDLTVEARFEEKQVIDFVTKLLESLNHYPTKTSVGVFKAKNTASLTSFKSDLEMVLTQFRLDHETRRSQGQSETKMSELQLKDILKNFLLPAIGNFLNSLQANKSKRYFDIIMRFLKLKQFPEKVVNAFIADSKISATRGDLDPKTIYLLSMLANRIMPRSILEAPAAERAESKSDSGDSKLDGSSPASVAPVSASAANSSEPPLLHSHNVFAPAERDKAARRGELSVIQPRTGMFAIRAAAAAEAAADAAVKAEAKEAADAADARAREAREAAEAAEEKAQAARAAAEAAEGKPDAGAKLAEAEAAERAAEKANDAKEAAQAAAIQASQLATAMNPPVIPAAPPLNEVSTTRTSRSRS